MKRLFILGLALAGLASCAPRLQPYSTRLHNEMQLGEDALKKVQFYVSKDIVLRRELKETETTIQRGRLEVVDGQRIEEVIIPSGTPGIIMYMPAFDKFALSFEEDQDQSILIFGADHGNFQLLAQNWKNSIGKVEYGGQTYYSTPQSAGAILLVDIRKLNKMDVSVRRASGRTVN